MDSIIRNVGGFAIKIRRFSKKIFLGFSCLFLIGFLLFCLLQIKHWTCAEGPFTGFQDTAIVSDRLPGDTHYESLLDLIEKSGGIDDVFPLQMIVDKDLIWVEEWVSCHNEHLLRLKKYFSKNQQTISLENYAEIGFHSALPAKEGHQFFDLEMASNFSRISKIGLLCVGKARIALSQESWTEAKVNLEHAFMIADFLMETNWAGIGDANSIYHDTLTLLVEQWPNHQFDLSMLKWLPRKNSMAFHSYRAEWKFYESRANYVRHIDEIPGEWLAGFLDTKIGGLDKEAIARIWFEDWLDFADQLQGPWLDWRPSPSTQLPRQKSFLDCQYLTAQYVCCLTFRFFPRMAYVGAILIKSARAEVEMRLALENEKISRASVTNLLSKLQLTNPFTDMPYSIDDQGNFVLESGKDIPSAAFLALQKIPLDGLVLKDSSGKTVERNRQPRVKFPWITM